jgi:hypothetical protein
MRPRDRERVRRRERQQSERGIRETKRLGERQRPRDRERMRERDRRPILHGSTPATRVPADSTGGSTIGEARDP